MAKSEFKNFATFETLITPKIITVIYWITSILLILGGILVFAHNNGGLTLGLAVALIAVRVSFELIMVSFKNNEYLRRICEAAEAKKGE